MCVCVCVCVCGCIFCFFVFAAANGNELVKAHRMSSPGNYYFLSLFVVVVVFATLLSSTLVLNQC